MPERFAGLLAHNLWLRRAVSRLPILLSALIVSAAASCTESIDGGGACPALCPSRDNEFRDTIVDGVVVDTSLGFFPSSGLSTLMLLANRGDTLQTSAVI